MIKNLARIRLKALMAWAAIFIGLIVYAGFLPQIASAGVNDFSIRSFEADYYLTRNENNTAVLQVREVIKPVFPDFDQNRGILRALPSKYNGHTLSLEIQSVTDENGNPWQYATYTENDNLVLKIGNPGVYVHGAQTYRISYEMRNVVNFFDTHDEFFWDINGDQWPQSFGVVTARIHIPKELSGQLDGRHSCFAGSYGFNELDCTINPAIGGSETVYTASASQVGGYQTLSVVVGFDKGTFVLGPEIAQELRRQRLKMFLNIAGLLLPVLVTSVSLYRKWSKSGRDPSGRGVIVPQYTPLNELNSLTSSILLNERLESKAISALIVELAVRKYIKIHEIPKKGLLGKKDYELEIISDTNDLASTELQALKMFFSGGIAKGTRIRLSSLKNKLYLEVKELDKQATNDLHARGYFINNPHKTRQRYIIIGIILIVVGFAALFLLASLPFAVGLSISGMITMAVSKTMPARSKLGVEAREYLLGMRDYMRLAEAERMRVLQSPDGAEKLPARDDPSNPSNQVKLFEKLLPYAMLFGIEKDWAKQFEKLYTQPPDWYGGDWKTFNAVNLASSIGGFSSAGMTSFSAPKSSGSSGFSGGGSSGGGGGGGGGGGW